MSWKLLELNVIVAVWMHNWGHDMLGQHALTKIINNWISAHICRPHEYVYSSNLISHWCLGIVVLNESIIFRVLLKFFRRQQWITLSVFCMIRVHNRNRKHTIISSVPAIQFNIPLFSTSPLAFQTSLGTSAKKQTAKIELWLIFLTSNFGIVCHSNSTF